jgi:hypothetical protein
MFSNTCCLFQVDQLTVLFIASERRSSRYMLGWAFLRAAVFLFFSCSNFLSNSILRTDLLILQISQKHAELEWMDDGWTIHDKGSSNGTKVNGKPLKPAAKADADNPGVPISLRSPPSIDLLVPGTPFVVLRGLGLRSFGEVMASIQGIVSVHRGERNGAN